MYVIFHTSVLNAAFLATISEPLYSVIDVDADTDPKSCPIATGPFMVKGFEVDTFIEMERYDGYWNGPSQIDSVTVDTPFESPRTTVIWGCISVGKPG